MFLGRGEPVISSRVGKPTGRRRQSRRFAWVAVVATGVLGLSIVSAAGAAGGPVGVPDGAIDSFTPVVAPLGLSNKPTTVIVQLPGNPITVADANASKSLSDADKKAIRAQLKAAQAPVAQQIEALGGTV